MNRQQLLLILRFLVSGGIGVIAYYTILYSLTEFAGMWYLASAIVAFFVNYVINFATQKFWTFQNKDIEAAPKQLATYLAMSVALLATNTGLLYFLVEYFHFQYLLAQLILTVLLTIASFVMTRKIFAN